MRQSSISSDTIWAKMYELRSLLAHGRTPDFSKDKLDCLKSFQVAFDLLRDVTRSVARYALEDPQLIADLREC
jgi:hypothetical protein